MKHKIIIGDCRKALKTLPDNSVHLVITSPPYNIGIGDEDWDSLPWGEYLELTKAWLKECYRVLVNGGKICINLPFNDRNNIASLHQKITEGLGFKFKNNIAWVKWNWQRKEKFAVSKWKLEKYKFPSQPNPILINAYEIILVMQKGYTNRRGMYSRKDLTYQEFQELKYNVWLIPPITNRSHPAPYPTELPRRLIKLYSLPGDTVLDPFLGTGSTTEAAKELNRNSVGIELNPEYIEMAKKKIGRESLSIENAERVKHLINIGHQQYQPHEQTKAI